MELKLLLPPKGRTILERRVIGRTPLSGELIVVQAETCAPGQVRMIIIVGSLLYYTDRAARASIGFEQAELRLDADFGVRAAAA